MKNLSQKNKDEIIQLLNENINRNMMYKETKKRNAKGIKGRYIQNKKGVWIWEK